MWIVVVLTVLGALLRLDLSTQSLFADEASTHWIVASRGLWDAIRVVHTDAEITPPLFFMASWLTTRLGDTPELLRAPSVVAGVAAIPLAYVIGLRTVGRRAAVVAAALVALSPFMAYYSSEARGYELMVVLVMLSTLALLRGAEGGPRWWWALYGAAACGAVYTHYTAVFALAGQLVWLLWAHPRSRRPALLATAAAVMGFLPWLSGLRSDLDSATTAILSALQPFTPAYVRTSLAHWVVGYPYAAPGTGVRDLPGLPALVMLAAAVALALAGLLFGRRRRRPEPGIVLVAVLALSVPVGEAVASAVSSNLFGTRNLAASWPGLALCLAALVARAPREAWPLATALAVGAFAIGAVKLLGDGFARPDYRAAAAFVDARARPSDPVVDGASLSPAGIPTALQIAFDRPHRLLFLDRDRVAYDPFRILATAPPVATVIARAAASRPPRLFVVLVQHSTSARQALDAVPPAYRPVAERTYPGVNPLQVVVFARRGQTATGA